MENVRCVDINRRGNKGFCYFGIILLIHLTLITTDLTPVVSMIPTGFCACKLYVFTLVKKSIENSEDILC